MKRKGFQDKAYIKTHHFMLPTKDSSIGQTHGLKGACSWLLEAGHTSYTLVTAPVATVALLDADVADGLSLLTYLGLRTEDVASGIMAAVSLGWNIKALLRL